MEELDNLRKAVGLPPRPIHMNMDPWTYGRISGPLEELVKKWKEWERTCILSGQTMLNWCASDLEELLTKWGEEADEEGEAMYADHPKEEAERETAPALPDLCFLCGGILGQCGCELGVSHAG